LGSPDEETRLEKKSQKPVTRMKFTLASLPILSDAWTVQDSGHRANRIVLRLIRPASAGFLMSGL